MKKYIAPEFEMIDYNTEDCLTVSQNEYNYEGNFNEIGNVLD